MKIKRDRLIQIIKEELDKVSQDNIAPEAQIYCDMDGVLVDFESFVIKLLNHVLAGGQIPDTTVSKARRYLLRRVKRELGNEWRVSAKEGIRISVVRDLMYEIVGSHPGYVFSNMSPFPDAISQLWPFLNSTGHTVNLLTAPIKARKHAPEGSSAAQGKRDWAKQLNPSPASVIISPAVDKATYAVMNGVKNILIDDRADTVNAWKEKGGIGILHIPGNSEKTIFELKQIGLTDNFNPAIEDNADVDISL